MLSTLSRRTAAQVHRIASRTMPTIPGCNITFDKVAREWRCKYTADASGGPADSASLKAAEELLQEYLPKLKALPGAEVTRVMCGGCLDFKVSITQPLEEHGAFMADLALEEEF